MRKVKSLFYTLLICGAAFGGLYFTPIELSKKDKKESQFPVVTEEEQLLGEENVMVEEKVEIPPVLPLPEIKPDENKDLPVSEEEKKPNVAESKEKPEKETVQVAKAEPQEKKKVAKKVEDKQNAAKKESKIGVDRKLISGIPGTMNYKGKFPNHNVKEKGDITISYTVDAGGNVISAYRIAGLRDRNTINNAITMLKKYVKAEKAKTNSTGTYTIKFK